MAIVKLAAIL